MQLRQLPKRFHRDITNRYSFRLFRRGALKRARSVPEAWVVKDIGFVW